MSKVNYNKIFRIEFECCSKDIGLERFNSYMSDAKIGNKIAIKRQMSILSPYWYDMLELGEKGDYKFQITDTHIIIPYDYKQYFFKYG